MAEPARGLRNVTADDGTMFCPKCKRLVAPEAPVIFRDDYALHVPCFADKVEGRAEEGRVTAGEAGRQNERFLAD